MSLVNENNLSGAENSNSPRNSTSLKLVSGQSGNISKWPEWRLLFTSPIFWTVLSLKLSISCFMTSHVMSELFVPFLNYFVESGFKNPWTYFGALGHWDAFPYSPVMLLTLAISRVLFHPILDAGTYTVTWLHLLVMRLPLIAGDVAMCLLLLRWFPNRLKSVLWLYWASPIVTYICYWHGQLDIIPTAIFLISLYLVYRGKFNYGMTVYGMALASKSHLVFALPFLLLYCYQQQSRRQTLKSLIAFAISFGICMAPVIGEPAFRKMVFGSAEQLRLFALQIKFADKGVSILVAPLMILVLFFRYSTYIKSNWDLLFTYLGLVFGVFVLLIPPAPGYYIWSIPFVVYFLCRVTRPTYFGLYAAYALSYLYFQITDLTPVFSHPETIRLTSNLAYTLMEASLAGMVLSMYLFGVRSNSIYNLRTAPVMIGLAGDSGAGKDFVVDLITDLMEEKRITLTNGDDYHRWPRGHHMWQVYTHLNLKANDLYREHEHAVALASGGRVVRGAYDHNTGTFSESRPVDPNSILIFSGLHSLSLKALRRLYDLKIYLDPAEDLRTHWKIQRDCKLRGYTASQVKEALQRRKNDAEKYILPQKNLADLVIRFSVEGQIPETGFPLLKLEIRALNSFNFTFLTERLSKYSTISLVHDPFIDPDWQQLEIKGTLTSEEVRVVANDAIPNLSEIAPNAKYRSDMDGCLQLIFLSCLSDHLRWNNHEIKAE